MQMCELLNGLARFAKEIVVFLKPLGVELQSCVQQ